jgi:diguanylate cyclase (GGDEF)-like protein
VLVGLSQIILASIRSTDYAVRYGSGEILLLLPNAKDKSLSVIAERIRYEAETSIGVTVSVGCASLLTIKSESKEDLIRASAEAMNISKNQGGNKVIIN